MNTYRRIVIASSLFFVANFAACSCSAAPGARGDFTLALKVYRANVHPEHPRGGAMSQYLDSLQV